MADKDTKQEEASAVAAPKAEAVSEPEVAAKAAAGAAVAAAEPEVAAKAEDGAAVDAAKGTGEEKATKDKGPDGKKKGNKKGKDGKGGEKGKGGGGKGKGPFGHGGTGFRLNVKNFGAEMTKDQLRALFVNCGKVTGAEVKFREDGKSRGFGFVIMSSEEEANMAITEMNNKDIGGKVLNVSPAERRPQEEEDDQQKGKGKGGKGKGNKDGHAEAMWHAQMQAAMWQQQMMAMQWYSYLNSGAAPAAVAPPVEPVPEAVEYEGSLKSISARNGYGFIVCAATYATYERDVYVDKEVLPEGAKPPDRVRFTVTLNAKGHPKAATCKAAMLV